MTQRTGNTSKRPSFADVKSAALKNIDRVLAHWLPNGKRVDGGKEFTAPNPTRTDKRAGSGVFQGSCRVHRRATRFLLPRSVPFQGSDTPSR